MGKRRRKHAVAAVEIDFGESDFERRDSILLKCGLEEIVMRDLKIPNAGQDGFVSRRHVGIGRRRNLGVERGLELFERLYIISP